ncbi:hypothetical protein F2Q69_00025184, partial [Brassica cretica]
MVQTNVSLAKNNRRLNNSTAKQRRRDNNERNPRIDRPRNLMPSVSHYALYSHLTRNERLARFRTLFVTNSSAGKAFSDKCIGNVKTGDLQNWIGDHFLRDICLYVYALYSHVTRNERLARFRILFVTNSSAGKAFSDKGIGNVKTGDLQNWIGDHFLRSKNWEGIKRCMADSTICKFRPRDVDFDAKHLSHVK